MVLLSKFGESRLKNEDFLKNGQNWPLGGTPEGGGKKIFENFSSNTERVLQCKFGEDWMHEARDFSTIIAKKKKMKMKMKKKKMTANGSETLLRRVKRK